MTDNRLTDVDYEELAQIMNGPHGLTLDPNHPVDLLVVFSCADGEVGRTAARLYHEGLVQHVLFSGGVGKDSAGLPRLSIAEAEFLASIAIDAGLPAEQITLELDATNGMQNALFGLQLALELGLINTNSRIGSLAPAQRCLRLHLELQYQAWRLSGDGAPAANSVSGFGSGIIDPTNPATRRELYGELRGLSTMHDGDNPRILRQTAFSKDGAYYRLVQAAGLGA